MADTPQTLHDLLPSDTACYAKHYALATCCCRAGGACTQSRHLAGEGALMAIRQADSASGAFLSNI